MLVSALLPHVLADAPNCPDVTASMAIVNAAIEFCRETQAWDEVRPPITLVDGQHSYALAPPTDASICMLRNVWAASRELRPVTMQELVQFIPDWQTAQGSEPAYYNAVRDSDELRVYPTPQLAQGAKLTVRVTYQPKLGATTLPDFLGDQHHEAIAHGALARLLMTPGRAWSNPALATYHKSLFDEAVVQARIDSLHERVQGTVTVRPRRFGF